MPGKLFINMISGKCLDRILAISGSCGSDFFLHPVYYVMRGALTHLFHVFMLQSLVGQFVSHSIFNCQERVNKFYQGIFQLDKG